jgi:hypothetical protein
MEYKVIPAIRHLCWIVSCDSVSSSAKIVAVVVEGLCQALCPCPCPFVFPKARPHDRERASNNIRPYLDPEFCCILRMTLDKLKVAAS